MCSFLLILSGVGLQWLAAGFGSQLETEAGLWPWACQMLASNPVVSDKALALWLCRKEFPQRQKVVKQIKYLLRGGKNKKYIWYMWIDTGVDSESLSHTLVAMGITFIGHLFQVSFRQSFRFFWFTVHIWYILGSSHVCTHDTTLSHDEFYWKGICIEHPLRSLPLWPPRSLSVPVWYGRSPDFENEKNVVLGGPSFLL